ncbi:metal ABC transporter substrate-binding protein [Siculibacillus lacustris]|uniref:Metal ABC transporter substrate-binding protein n=1 Tax=Siculibacillus lacustris TaxID=1549641 RepID=A0A4Q9VXU1_9HYPH|nr:metal ABC transporter substrate-binding protein [Siculibacillus lacustris]TBW40757.1 metal ABC transporter substrate-binding protein [Siculibacillus lacustris]
MTQVSRRLVSAALAGLALLSLAAVPSARAEDAKLPVVASFSILGDFVTRIGGDRVALTTLVGPNGDAHVYEPTPADARAVQAAKLVVINGLGFEGWIERLSRASATKATIVAATRGIAPREMEDEDAKPVAGKKPIVTDPHAWQAVANARIYAANIRDALTAADPDGRAIYAANAEAYLAELSALEGEVRAAVAAVPQPKRRVITSHDAFGYFAVAYGIEFLAPQGVSTEAEANAKAIGKLIRQIKAEKITAVFIENMSDRRLIDRIAKETGVTPGGELFADALSPKGGPAPTYVDMVRHNVRLLTRAMIGS